MHRAFGSWLRGGGSKTGRGCIQTTIGGSRIWSGVMLIRCKDGCDWCSWQWGWTRRWLWVWFSLSRRLAEQTVAMISLVKTWLRGFTCGVAGGGLLGCSTMNGRRWLAICWSLAVLVACGYGFRRQESNTTQGWLAAFLFDWKFLLFFSLLLCFTELFLSITLYAPLVLMAL